MLNGNKKLYINIKDYQTGTFAVGCYGTLKHWREKTMAWCDMDEHYGLYQLLKYYKIKNNELIDFINDYWDIEIVEYDQTKDLKEYELEQEDLYYLGED